MRNIFADFVARVVAFVFPSPICKRKVNETNGGACLNDALFALRGAVATLLAVRIGEAFFSQLEEL
jgi:hypothetical protein